MSEVSAYIQPDHFDSDKKNVNDFLGQNPLLLLARTCQNIGVEPKSASSTSSSLSGSSSVKSMTNGTVKLLNNSSSNCSNSNATSFTASFNKGSTSRTVAKATTTMVPPVQTLPTLNGISQNGQKMSQSVPIPPAVPTSTVTPEEPELYIPPSSNSLIQLARLSSSLKIPTTSSASTPSLGTERQKRNTKSLEAAAPTSKFGLGSLTAPPPPGMRPHKRARRQSFGRNSGNPKPLDFSSHLSSHSSPLSTSSSSVSPSSLRSTPPTHTSPPPLNIPQLPSMNPASFELMKSLATAGLSMPVDSCTSTVSNPLEAFFSVGSLLGASPESLRELLVSIARSLSDRRAAESNLLLEQQQQQQQPKLLQGCVSDPSTQCLYCGHVCSDMSSLVQHIYTHLASLHKQQTEAAAVAAAAAAAPPPLSQLPAPITPPTSTSPFDLATFYAKLLQKTPENQPPASPFQPPMVSTDPSSLFLAWLNLFRPVYAEGLTGAANR